jgi:hypothetical protein
MRKLKGKRHEAGFTAVEVMLACVIFPIIVIGLANAFQVVQKSYSTARELNEMYAVLSACPEIDRALEFNSLSSTTNCFPNNSFISEGGGSSVITYSPVLTVINTADLASADPLKTVPDSKVVDISVGFQKSTAPPLKLRMLVTRNGVGQQ